MRPAVVTALFLTLAAAPAAAERAVVADPHYGEALFHFYQADYPTAIAKLLAADETARLPNHDAEAELLLGGMYLSYGLTHTADDIFHRLLARETDRRVRDRAWFYLARSHFRRGNPERAHAALASIEKKLGRDLEPERQMLTAQLLMSTGDDRAAVEALDAWRARGDWQPYADYNLGVALARLGELDTAVRLLTGVGKLRSRDTELAALRDKANLALGFTLIQAERHDDAARVLERVRLDGPFSSKALLGLGWAQSAGGDNLRALVPWQTLQTRSLLDPAVQESWLAAPYAYRNLGALGQAAEAFEAAVVAYADEIDRIDAASVAIRDGDLLPQIVATRLPGGTGIDFGSAPEAHLLTALYADHEFQAGLKNYVDLIDAHRTVTDWQRRVAVFQNMLDNRVRAYAEREPEVRAAEQPQAIARLSARYDALAGRLTAARASNDPVVLANADELASLDVLDAADARIRALPAGEEREEIGARARLLRGVLAWDVAKAFPARAHHADKELKALRGQLDLAVKREDALARAFVDGPARFAGFDARIAALTPRMASLAQDLTVLAARQDARLAERALFVLNEQRTRLQSYLAEAQFGLAAIYDRAVAESEP